MYEFSVSGVLIPEGIEINKIINKMLEHCFIPVFIETQGEEFEEIRQKVLDDDDVDTQGVIHFIKYETPFEA